MRELKISGIVSVLALFAACTSVSVPATVQDELSLFDGSTLNGWKVTEENPGSFRVEDGAIIAEGPRAHLFYDGEHGKSFEDFELSLQVKTMPGANSGVYFHTHYQLDDWPRHGLEAQVNATQQDFRKTGSIYAIADLRVYATEQEVPALGVDNNAYITRDVAPHTDDEWFEYVIRVEDGVVSTRVNGRLLVQWAQPEDWPDAERRLGAGTFGLQAHDPGSKVYYKDIKVLVLD